MFDCFESKKTISTGVSQWNDLSGRAEHAVQATGSKQPTLNNKRGIFFTSSSLQTLETTTNFVFPEEYTAFTTFEMTGSGTGSNFPGISSHRAGTSEFVSNCAYVSSSSVIQGANSRSGESKTTSFISTSQLNVNYTFTMRSSFSLDMMRSYNSGRHVSSNDNLSVWVTNNDTLSLGWIGTGSNYMDGYIKSFILYNRLLTEPMVHYVTRYLNNRFLVNKLM